MNELETRTIEVADVLKMLAHPKRLLILCKLSEGEQKVSDLENHCKLSQSQLSQFLGKMRSDKILQARKEGHFVFYRVNDEKMLQLLQTLSHIYCHNSH
jgi:DNA-binding transcriptional ArsR family regulator